MCFIVRYLCLIVLDVRSFVRSFAAHIITNSFSFLCACLTTMAILNANRVTADYYARLGKTLLKRKPDSYEGIEFHRAFRELFGCTPRVCVTLWRHCRARHEYRGAHPRHILWALLQLKVYATNIPLCTIAGTSRSNFTKWIWRYIPSIAALRPRVVSPACCHLSSPAVPCLLLV